MSLHFVVGSEECPVKDVVEEFCNERVSDVLSSNIGALIMQLDLPSSDADSIKSRLIFKMMVLKEAYNEVITNWTVKKGDKATLGELNRALRILKLNLLADNLEKRFPIVIPDDDDAGGDESGSPPSNPSAAEIMILLERQQAHLQKYGVVLVKNTVINTGFLAWVKQEGLLSDFEYADLNAEINQMTKTQKFYDIIGRKQGSFPGLIKALKETRQTGALPFIQEFKG